MKYLPLYLSNICLQNVASIFATFQDPDMRGENFNWSNFPEFAAKSCERQYILNSKNEISPATMTLVHKFGLKFATRLLNESKLLK